MLSQSKQDLELVFNAFRNGDNDYNKEAARRWAWLLQEGSKEDDASMLLRATEIMVGEHRRIMQSTYQTIIDGERVGREIKGRIENNFDFVQDEVIGSAFMVPPETREALAPWHSHPSTVRADGVFFTPPSTGDIYMAIVGALTRGHRMSFIVTGEGIYTIVITRPAMRRAFMELYAIGILQEDDPFVYFAEPIIGGDEDGGVKGLMGFRFEPYHDNFPYMKAILGFRFDHYELANTETLVARFQDDMRDLGIDIFFTEGAKLKWKMDMNDAKENI